MKSHGPGKRPRADHGQTPGHRGESCRACSKRFEELLRATFGDARSTYKLPGMSARLEDYRTITHYGTLARIYAALQDYRGHRELVRSRTLRPCDFYVSDPGFVVELDERQHFTLPRKLALSLYPSDLALGFDRNRWMRLCEEVAATDKDSGTPFRDEQRAWYETLRDFAPAILGLHATVRIRRRDAVWCSMDVDSPADVSEFRAIVEGRNG